MTPKEALKEITSKPKWYVVLMGDGEKRDTYKESTLRVTALRIHNGSAESSAMRRFFERFGYRIHVEVTKDE